MAKKTAKKKTTKREKSPYDLVIVESPSKAKTIKKYLGRGYQVVASNGHIKDLPKSKLGVDVKGNFEIDLVPITGKKDKIERIQELAKGATQIYLAPIWTAKVRRSLTIYQKKFASLKQLTAWFLTP